MLKMSFLAKQKQQLYSTFVASHISSSGKYLAKKLTAAFSPFGGY